MARLFSLCIAVCLVAALAATATAAPQQDAPRTDCTSPAAARFNFFPSNVINLPDGWTQRNQNSAGNFCNGQLLPIALYGRPKPQLHFQPLHDLLNAGARVDVSLASPPKPPAPPNITAVTFEEDEEPFAVASFREHLLPGEPAVATAAVLPAATQQQKPFGSSERPTPFKGLFKPKPKKAQLTREARNKVLHTFIQVLLTGDPPGDLEVLVDNAAAAVAAAGNGGGGRPQPLRSVAFDPGNGPVEYYVSRDRILLEGEADSSRSSSSSSTSSSSSSSRSGRQHSAISTAALQEKAGRTAAGQGSSFSSSTAAAASRQQVEPAIGFPKLQLPWNKDSDAAAAAGAHHHPIMAGLASLLPGSSRPADADGGSSGSSGSNAPEQWTVVVPVKFVYSVEVNGKHWYSSQVHHPNASVAQIDFQGNSTAGRRDLFDPEIFTEGINRMSINITLLQDSAVLSNGMTNRTGPPTNVTFGSPQIDFYFFMWGNATHDSRPSAVVEFESCRAEASVNFSKARPTPVLIDGYRLTYKPMPDRTTAFFLPVYLIYGQFQKGLDGSTDLRTDNTEGNIKNFGLYLTRLPGSPSNFSFGGPQLDGLKEGWWQFSVEGSLWVPLPHLANLLSLSGIDRYGNSDVLYREIQPNGRITGGMSLLNSVKGAGWVLPDYSNMRVGLQKAVTVLDSFEGPSAPLVLGDKATFSWQWTGLDSGDTKCLIEGKGTVGLAGNCSSPLTYTVRTNLNQTLSLDYTDVCNKHHNASLTFGPSFGWHVESKESGQGDLQAITAGTQATLLQSKNSGGRALLTGLAGVWCRAVGAAVAAWLLAAAL